MAICLPYKVWDVVGCVELTTHDTLPHVQVRCNVVHNKDGTFFAILGETYSGLELQEAETQQEAFSHAYRIARDGIDRRIAAWKIEQEEIKRKAEAQKNKNKEA